MQSNYTCTDMILSQFCAKITNWMQYLNKKKIFKMMWIFYEDLRLVHGNSAADFSTSRIDELWTKILNRKKFVDPASHKLTAFISHNRMINKDTLRVIALTRFRLVALSHSGEFRVPNSNTSRWAGFPLLLALNKYYPHTVDFVFCIKIDLRCGYINPQHVSLRFCRFHRISLIFHRISLANVEGWNLRWNPQQIRS